MAMLKQRSDDCTECLKIWCNIITTHYVLAKLSTHLSSIHFHVSSFSAAFKIYKSNQENMHFTRDSAFITHASTSANRWVRKTALTQRLQTVKGRGQIKKQVLRIELMRSHRNTSCLNCSGSSSTLYPFAGSKSELVCNFLLIKPFLTL